MAKDGVEIIDATMQWKNLTTGKNVSNAASLVSSVKQSVGVNEYRFHIKSPGMNRNDDSYSPYGTSLHRIYAFSQPNSTDSANGKPAVLSVVSGFADADSADFAADGITSQWQNYVGGERKNISGAVSSTYSPASTDTNHPYCCIIRSADTQIVSKIISVFDIRFDVNGDGVFSVADVTMLQRWLLGDSNITLKNWKSADLCNDGRLDVFDLCLMKQKLLQNN